MNLQKKIINKFLMWNVVSHIKTNGEKIVYLTFDDGPEPGITEFVLNELDNYNYKATFFCTGKNALAYPDLMKYIKNRGHSIGNHSYSHKHAYLLSAKDYVEDVEKADRIIDSIFFRPPNGCLLFSSWLTLRKKYKIFYWSIGSGDWRKENFDFQQSMAELKKTKSGDIILFHFSNDLETGTRKLLPSYLKWLSENGFVSKTIPE